LRPKKCIGKKVRLTPIKRSQNTPLTRVLLKDPPENRGIHKVKPKRTPKTAPKERT
jgi:hypothetical protein